MLVEHVQVGCVMNDTCVLYGTDVTHPNSPWSLQNRLRKKCISVESYRNLCFRCHFAV